MQDTWKGIIVVISAFLIHLTYGCIYTIGNMAPYISSYILKYVDADFNKGAVVWISAGALASQGLVMSLGGILAPKIGAKLVIIIGSIICSGVYLLNYFSIKYGFVLFLITHLLSLGIGVGFGYSVVLQAASSWFPGKSGLIVGIIASGFGLGALVFTPIQLKYINPNNVKINNITRNFEDEDVLSRIPTSFLIVGSIMFGLQLIGCIFIRSKANLNREKKNSVNDAIIYDSENCDLSDEEKDSANGEVNLTPGQALRCRYFYLLWFLMFCHIIPITLVTSAYKLIGQEAIDDDLFLSTIATLSSLFNCLGRLFWGYLVDKFSFKVPMSIMLVIWASSLFFFPNLFFMGGIMKYLYAFTVCLMFFSLSGVFAMMPAATRIIFGPKNMATNYGMVFSAFAVGSLLSALASDLSRGKWSILFYSSGSICLLSLFLLSWIFDPKLPKKCAPIFFCAKHDYRK